MIENVDIVLGCSFGDEGKGKVVYDLLHKNNYNLCIRFNGSGNAGHTIYKNKQKFVVHQLPVGILLPNVYNLISSDCLIDISRLKTEIDELKLNGIDITGRLFISKACHIITPECIEYDKLNNKIGTTGSGIGPTFSLKMLRTGKRVEEFIPELTAIGAQVVDMRKFWFSDFVKNYIRNILLEGAQGFELDINWTDNYPFCTSSTCTLGGAINTGIPINKIRHIFGISKAYDTYVGAFQFQPQEFDEQLNKIGDLGHEYGATTGRRRQVNFLNLNKLIESLIINNCNSCIINKLDILADAEIYKLYYDGQLISFQSLLDFQSFISDKLSFLPNKPIFSFTPFSIL